jgi:MFS superfamily sulfate permease-like transporter
MTQRYKGLVDAGQPLCCGLSYLGFISQVAYLGFISQVAYLGFISQVAYLGFISQVAYLGFISQAQDSHERLLRNLDAANTLHPFLAFLLLLQ